MKVNEKSLEKYVLCYGLQENVFNIYFNSNENHI